MSSLARRQGHPIQMICVAGPAEWTRLDLLGVGEHPNISAFLGRCERIIEASRRDVIDDGVCTSHKPTIMINHRARFLENQTHMVLMEGRETLDSWLP